MINLGKLKIDPAAIASQGNAILGIRDSGKTYTATWLAERLFGSGIPFVAFDPIGVWRFLRVPGKGHGYPVVVAGGTDGDLPLTVGGAPEIVRAAMANGVSLVIDLFDINLSKADWKRIVTACVRVLLHENSKHGLRHVFIEEAAEFAPQRVGPDQGQVYAEMEKLARMGGNARLGYTLINQRAEEVNKALLELCDNLFLHRQKGRNSLTALSKWLDIGNVSAGKEIIATLPTLPTGECWAWLQGSETPELVKVPAKNSLHPDRRIMRGDDAAPIARAVDVGSFVATMKGTLSEIEKEVETVAELKAEVAKLRRLKTPAAAGVSETEVQRRIRDAVAEALKHSAPAASNLHKTPDDVTRRKVAELARKILQLTESGDRSDSADRTSVSSRTVAQPLRQPDVASPPRAGMSGPEQRILDAIAWMTSIGVPEPDQAAVAFLSGYSGASNGAYKNPRGALNQRGLVRYISGGAIALTDAGVAAANMPGTPASATEIHERVLGKLGGPEQRILRRLIEAYPKVLQNDRLAMDAGYTDASNGAYKNPRGRLRTFGLIEYRDGGVVARSLLFPEAKR